jgi:hypothetical protein
MRHTHTFVLKILLDQESISHLRGQISEPSSGDEWRANFANGSDLIQQLLKRVAAASDEMERELAPPRLAHMEKPHAQGDKRL